MASAPEGSSSAFSITTRSGGCVSFDLIAKVPTYGYVPHLEAGVVYTAVFAIILTVTLWQTITGRKWWYFCLVLGVLGKNHLSYVCIEFADLRFTGELIGWAGRIGAHFCPYNSSFFSLQISILIIGECTNRSRTRSEA